MKFYLKAYFSSGDLFSCRPTPTDVFAPVVATPMDLTATGREYQLVRFRINRDMATFTSFTQPGIGCK